MSLAGTLPLALTVFALAILCGFAVISKVPATLHTPLMSGANSIHGIVLVGSMFIAIGIFASSCTRHQLLAATISTAILALLTFVVDYGAEYCRRPWERVTCAYLNIFGHFGDFSKGILDSKSIIFFVSGTIFFLFLATKVMESRRWR